MLWEHGNTTCTIRSRPAHEERYICIVRGRVRCMITYIPRCWIACPNLYGRCDENVRVHTCIHILAHSRVDKYTHAHICIYTHARSGLDTPTHTYIYIYTHTHTPARFDSHTHTHTHMHIYTYTHAIDYTLVMDVCKGEAIDGLDLLVAVHPTKPNEPQQLVSHNHDA
jgi:hypothetical protein